MPSGTATTAASTKPPNTRQIGHADVLEEAVLARAASQPSRSIVSGIGEEGPRDEAAEGGERPGGDEQHEERDAERRCALPADGLERRAWVDARARRADDERRCRSSLDEAACR